MFKMLSSDLIHLCAHTKHLNNLRDLFISTSKEFELNQLILFKRLQKYIRSTKRIAK